MNAFASSLSAPRNNVSTSRSRALLAGLLSALAAASALADQPVLQARFNSTDDITLQNGATLGPDGSGVSGKKEDRCYSADAPNWIAGSKGPAVKLAAGTPVSGVAELTITAWYRPRAQFQDATTLFSAGGTTLIWEQKTSQWVLRIDTALKGGGRSMNWFGSGCTPKKGSWETPGEWIFIAMVWKNGDKQVTFYQGSKNDAAQVAKQSTRKDYNEPLSEKPDRARMIGNRDKEMDRPFNGEIDDVRVFTTALDEQAVEKIRKADLQNESVSVP